ncbi:2-amino-4-hydroxy-6-hydroxymethyldihydropteridine diphosphokinase [Comamonadaceae bacterium M7527]|nr:2-amino-4-hydroxy-6-hydroxymethyldihydropteridine diphosphokinase [Comamonadaceae bacterium M7527]
MAVRCFIALGANLGDARAQVLAAASEVAALGLPGTSSLSPLYASPPWQADGPDYVNAVMGMDTTLTPPQLLAALQAIELAGGRVRSYANAPRTLDLDVLLYGSASIGSPQLTVPHPRMWQRAFVVLPLRDVAPHLVSDAQLQAVADQPIRQIH